MDSIIGFVEFLIGAIVVLVALVLILLVVISRMPADNPLRRVLNLLVARVAATAAAGVLAVPLEPIPGLDVLYGIGAPLLLLYYWYVVQKDTANFVEGATRVSEPSGGRHHSGSGPSHVATRDG